MAFQIKSFVSIVAGMLNHLRGTTVEVTDFREGGVVRSMVEAPAVEIDQLYQQMFIGLREAIPVAVYKTFDFEKLPAQFTSGMVTFSANRAAAADIAIPFRTAVRVPGGVIKYLTKSAGVLVAGASSVSLSVAADTIGVAGNIAAAGVTELVGAIAGISAVSNGVELSNGRDVESDDDRKIRFQFYISTLARGTNAAIIYGAKTTTITNGAGLITEAVVFASIVEPYLLDATQPPSVIACRVHNGVGGTSGALVAIAQAIVNGYQVADGTIVPGWKAAGVLCTVLAANEVTVPVSGTLTILKNHDGAVLTVAAMVAVNAYLQALPIGTEVVRSEIIAVIMAIEGVYNVVLGTPAADVPISVIDKAMPSASSSLTWAIQ